MGTKLITAPIAEPLTLAEVKAHLRVDHNDEDSIIAIYLKAARLACELFTGKVFMPQTWQLVLDNFPAQIQVPKPPLIVVTNFVYDNGEGVETQLMEFSDFVVDNANQPGWIVPVNSTWPTPIDAINSVRITYNAGFADDEVPEDIKAAILLTIGTLYENRESIAVGAVAMQLPAKVPGAAEQLLRQHLVDFALA